MRGQRQPSAPTPHPRSLGYRLRSRTLEVALGYAPRLTVRQIDATPQPDLLHHGTFALQGHDPNSQTWYKDIAVKPVD